LDDTPGFIIFFSFEWMFASILYVLLPFKKKKLYVLLTQVLKSAPFLGTSCDSASREGCGLMTKRARTTGGWRPSLPSLVADERIDYPQMSHVAPVRATEAAGQATSGRQSWASGTFVQFRQGNFFFTFLRLPDLRPVPVCTRLPSNVVSGGR